MSEPLGMRSCAKRPLPLCDRRTLNRNVATIDHRFCLASDRPTSNCL
jgi:hypothetical protein